MSRKTALVTYGKFIIPTWGHDKLVQKMCLEAHGRSMYCFATTTSSWKEKHLARAYPSLNFHLTTLNLFEIAQILYAQGYSDLVLYVGSDRVNWENKLKQYNWRKTLVQNDVSYCFHSINVKCVGDRENSISSTQMREFVQNQKFFEFRKNLSYHLRQKDEYVQDIWDDVFSHLVTCHKLTN